MNDLCLGLLDTIKAGRINPDEVYFTQIKEKFGGLRTYTGGTTPAMLEAVLGAGGRAYKTHERCGKTGSLRSGCGMRTRCDGCDETYCARMQGREATWLRKDSGIDVA